MQMKGCHMLQKFNALLFASCLCTMSVLYVSCFCTVSARDENQLKFDIDFPATISMKKQLTYNVSFKNHSKNSVLVPNFLLGGMGIFYYYHLFDESGNNVIPLCIVEYNFGQEALNNKPNPLQPNSTRTVVDYLPTEDFFPRPGRYRMVFHWDGYLDGGANDERSHFSCEKWITVTK
jgi:hypothetical protein